MSKSGALEPTTVPINKACVNASFPLTTGSTCANEANPSPISTCVEVSIYFPPSIMLAFTDCRRI